MNEPANLPEEEYVESPGPSPFERARQAGIVLGTLAIVFSVGLWIGEYAGWKTDIPYVLVGIAGLVVYNLARLPAYVRHFFPKEEAPGPKFHRRD